MRLEVDAPVVGRALLVGAAFAFAVSLGEFGATSFLARPENPTLPVVIYQLVSRPGDQNFGMALAALLLSEGYRVLLVDPLGAEAARAQLGDGATVARGVEQAMTDADMVVITTPFGDLRQMSPSACRRSGEKLPVLDPWGVLAGSAVADAVRLLCPGRALPASHPRDDASLIPT